MIKGNDNLNCNFAEDLMSYLYGEIGTIEKGKFEAHLKICLSCADEIAEFGTIRSAIIDWRERDFAPLQTPVIEFPRTEKFDVANVVTATESRTWLASLREFFSLSPVWKGSAIACAALMIFAGLFYLTVNSPKNSGDLISEANTKTSVIKPTISPTISAEKTPEIAEIKQPLPDSSKPQNSQITKAAKAVSVSEKPVTRILTKTVEPTKVKTRVKSSGNVKPENVRTRAKNSSDVQMIGDESDEDDSLRLADLFAEVDGK